MPTIFRLEHRTTGAGCYNSGTGSFQVIDKWVKGNLSGPRHPGPSDDSLLASELKIYNLKPYTRDFLSYYFGFTSIEQFRAWFYEDCILEDLFCLDYVLLEIESSCVLPGNTQAMYYKPYSKILNTYELTSFIS